MPTDGCTLSCPESVIGPDKRAADRSLASPQPCDCSGGGGNAPAPVTAASPAKEPASLVSDPMRWAQENPWKTGGLVVAGVVTGGAVYYGGQPLLRFSAAELLLTAAAQ